MSDIEIKCPECGNTDVTKMSIVEDVPMVSSIARREGNDLSYSGDSSDSCYDAIQNRHLICMFFGEKEMTGSALLLPKYCRCNFPLPEGISVLCD